MKLSDLSEIDRQTLSLRSSNGAFKPRTPVEHASCVQACNAGASDYINWWRLTDYGPAIALRQIEKNVRRFRSTSMTRLAKLASG